MEPAGNIEMIPARRERLPSVLCQGIKDTKTMKMQRRTQESGEQTSGDNFAFPSVVFGGFPCEFPSGIPRDNFLPALDTSEHGDTAQRSTSVCNARDSTLNAFLLRMLKHFQIFPAIICNKVYFLLLRSPLSP